MHQTGEPWRLGHRPALDGLRGLAVLMVVANHAIGLRYNAAGTIGVTVFFTLSGFLITSLLLDEWETAGGIDLRRFYLRRLRRLGPALAALLLVATAFAAAGSTFFNFPEIIFSGLYVSNIVAAAGMELNALAHTWSLAVEEQFYLLWPPLLLLARGRARWVLALCGAGILTSMAVRELVWPGMDGAYTGLAHTYFGLDARADALLVGCALAVVMRRLSEGRTYPWVAVLLLAVLAVAGMDQDVPRKMLLWPAVAAWVTALVILLVARGPYRGVLAWGPLRLVGQRSYGLYLWHVPVFMAAESWGAPFLVKLIVLGGASWGLTLLSWRFVEQPFLRRKPKPVVELRRAHITAIQ